MKTGRLTFSEAERSADRDERQAIIDAAALALKRKVHDLRRRSPRHVEDAEEYLNQAWCNYHQDGQLGAKIWNIAGPESLIGLLVKYGTFCMLRDAYPSHFRRRLVPIDIDSVDVGVEQVSPADELEDWQRREREADFLNLMESAVELEIENDRADILRLVALLRNDIEAQKPGGFYNLNANYVSEKLGVSPNRASKLWSRFKKICRQATTPELNSLIDEINPRWSDLSDEAEQDAARQATSQNKSHRA
jgi:hypothetical protein